jgi:DNA-binding NarL/FixJ family response regulator
VSLTSAAPIRVILFKRPFVDAFHLRLAIGMSLLWCDVQVLDRSNQGMRTACAIVRSGHPLPGLILLEREPGDDVGSFPHLIRHTPELETLPLVVLGDGEDPDAERHALEEGADAFIPLPTRASELARTGREIARFWVNHGAHEHSAG